MDTARDIVSQYLIDTGIIQSELDIDRLATMTKIREYTGDVEPILKEIEDAKSNLDYSIELMNKHRNSIQKIHESVVKCEKMISKLHHENEKLTRDWSVVKNKSLKNQILI